MQKKFGKLILFIDRARQHHRSIMVREYIKQNKDVLKVIYFPKGSSEFNAIEECWRQGKYNLLASLKGLGEDRILLYFGDSYLSFLLKRIYILEIDFIYIYHLL